MSTHPHQTLYTVARDFSSAVLGTLSEADTATAATVASSMRAADATILGALFLRRIRNPKDTNAVLLYAETWADILHRSDAGAVIGVESVPPEARRGEAQALLRRKMPRLAALNI